MNGTWKLSVAALLALGTAGLVSAQGIDELVAKVRPNFVTDEMLLNADKDANNWMHYGKDYQSTRYSQLTSTNQGNVRKMSPAWNLSFGTLDGQDSQAVVVNGTIYVTTSYNKVIATNGATGEIIWKYERELPSDVYPKLCCDVVNRGVAVYKDKVYLATLDAHIVALNNATGKVVWDKKIGDYTYAETFTIMPMALRGRIVGVSRSKNGLHDWVKGVDAESGEVKFQTHTPTVDSARVERGELRLYHGMNKLGHTRFSVLNSEGVASPARDHYNDAGHFLVAAPFPGTGKGFSGRDDLWALLVMSGANRSSMTRVRSKLVPYNDSVDLQGDDGPPPDQVELDRVFNQRKEALWLAVAALPDWTHRVIWAFAHHLGEYPTKDRMKALLEKLRVPPRPKAVVKSNIDLVYLKPQVRKLRNADIANCIGVHSTTVWRTLKRLQAAFTLKFSRAGKRFDDEKRA